MITIVYFPDVKGKLNVNVLQGSVFPKADFFDLECFKKNFGRGIAIGISFVKHADLYEDEALVMKIENK